MRLAFIFLLALGTAWNFAPAWAAAKTRPLPIPTNHSKPAAFISPHKLQPFALAPASTSRRGPNRIVIVHPASHSRAGPPVVNGSAITRKNKFRF
jgi:hypothetical protein